ncbi:putative oxoglutarate/iron-dependent dioxygenase, non-heme dioxygenase domain-containing protein [Helianthus annuus]|uniref:Oxoglutarate/iron-dependent dioxygenase, non-heme dioxygenase domain-containing protein n=1 Tax=Helianthus annuus TaxID=4232 RepID=A0A251RVR8_HELAN|nr:2-oxoglutarate-dependent dioxygenase AOP3 [Helianthus annuus]KAF5758178.1 putative oxoglutarate/iron-dependent dioxygenase, non-heme dioxygenase domain-containing protein [Helianthus annuus]KAJ0436563.1 putative oxoglutarate/iron-dependent dioxygenase, non-heme dioxygenase domain-containing protein [Helianthus annuus]
MGSSTQPKLPVIDLSSKSLNLNSSSWVTKCDEVTRALEEYGCFIALYDGVSSELRDATFLASQELFNLPTEVKALNITKTPYNGYIGQQPMVPLYESLGIEDVNTKEGAESFTKLMWPSGNQSFSESVVMYSKAVVELDKIVMKMIVKSYGIEENYESIRGSTTYLLKPTKYLRAQGDEKMLGLREHTDKSFMTYLHQDEVNGLEIKTKDGEWIEVDYTSSSFVVMAGDAFMAWTNGRIESPTHRVMMTADKDRYVLGLFASIRDHIIEVPQQLVDENHPLQFRPFDNYKYMQFYYTEEGVKAECAIRTYCGV